MKTKLDDFVVHVPNLDGTAVAKKITIKIPLNWDEEFGMWVLAPEANRLIEDTKAEAMGLLLPAQLKELRLRLGFSQKEMGELFQVGFKSWTRWESGKHRATRSINLLIRALYDGEISVNYLLKRAGKAPIEHATSIAWAKVLQQLVASHSLYPEPEFTGTRWKEFSLAPRALHASNHNPQTHPWKFDQDSLATCWTPDHDFDEDYSPSPNRRFQFADVL